MSSTCTKSPPLLTTTQRRAYVLSLTVAACKRGEGSDRQQEAYREWEWRRCLASFNYWRDTYGYLKLKSGEIIKWDKPFPVTTKMGELWQANASTNEVKARQLAETTNASHFTIWDCMFHHGVTWNILAADMDAGKDVLDRMRATLDRLPRWMVERAHMTEGAWDRGDGPRRGEKQESVQTVAFGLSKVRILSGAVSKAQGLAGKVLLDDFGKHEQQDRKWQLIYPVIDDPDPKNRGQVIIIFNGNGQDAAYNLYQKSKRGENCMRAFFHSWKDDPRRLEVIDSETGRKGGVQEDGSEWWPWYETAREQYLNDPENPEADEYAFKAMYPSSEDEAFYLHGNSRFSLAYLNAVKEEIGVKHASARDSGERYVTRVMLETLSDGVKPTPHNKGKWLIYEAPEKGASYGIGVDTAGGGASGDFACCQILKVYRDEENHVCGKQVAVYHTRIEPALMAAEIAKGARYYNDALVEVEANGHGSTVLDRLKGEYWNLYRRKITSKFSDSNTDTLGYWMDSVSKKRLIDQLAAFFAEARVDFADLETVDECSNYAVDERDITNAPKGMHDDRVLALAHAVEAIVDVAEWSQSVKSRIYMPWEV